MPLEKSAGAVVFHSAPKPVQKIEYLLLGKDNGRYWSFPKGLIEGNETLEQTAEREVREETGINDFILLPGFKETEKFFFKVKYDYQIKKGWRTGENVLKIVSYFLFQAKTKDVKVSSEHESYLWLNYDNALNKISFPAAKKILAKANEFLKTALF